MLYCFLDTNIFLQFQTFDEIDWLSILKTDAVCLVVAKKVIQELDEHKINPSRERLRKRSRMILNKLLEYAESENPVRIGVTVKIQTTSPKSDWLERNGYDLSYADDKIVGAAHYFKEINPDYEVLVFSDDTGVRLKARANGIPYVSPPDEIKLSDEPDPLQKENQELKREIQRLTYTKPKLSLQIMDSNDNLSTVVDFNINFYEMETSEEDIEFELIAYFKTLKFTGRVEGENAPENEQNIFNFSIDLGMYPTREQVDEYHQQLDRFITLKYRPYLKQLKKFKHSEQHTALLNIILENNGGAPAENIDVWLHFPDGIDVLDQPPLPPVEPSPPQKPKPFDPLDSVYMLGDVRSDLLTSVSYPNPNAYSLERYGPSISIRKTNSYEIDWGSVDLKHHYTYPLPNLYLYFVPIDKPLTVYEIEYEIIADNLPDKVEGKLIIRVHKI